MKLNFDLFPLIIHPEDLSLWNNFLEIIPQHLQALHEKRNEIDHISCTVRLIRKNSYTKDPLSQVLYQRMIPVWKNEKISYLICSVESVAYKKNGFYLHSITDILGKSTDAGNLGHDFAMLAGLVLIALLIQVIFLRPKVANMTDEC